MSQATPPKFVSEDLQKAVDASDGALASWEETRNRVSNDIRKLEAYLEQCGCKEPFRVAFGKAFAPQDANEEAEVKFQLRETGGTSCTIAEDALIWGLAESGRYRLLYELSLWKNGCWEEGEFYCDDSKVEKEVKPLIETKFEIRRRMFKELPGFVRALTRHLSLVQSPAASVDLDDRNANPF